ncbi:unnamed protein product [Symbiodinium sp. CCMP2456]|nr:unnamed protein product [Symbiodinium sp. CCMP2456]
MPGASVQAYTVGLWFSALESLKPRWLDSQSLSAGQSAMPRKSAVKAKPLDEAPDIPPGYEEQFAGLRSATRAQLAKMLRDLGLPVEGTQQQMALQLVQALAAAKAEPLASDDRESDLPKEEAATPTSPAHCDAPLVPERTPSKRIRSKRAAEAHDSPGVAGSQRSGSPTTQGLPKLQRTGASENLGAGPVEPDEGCVGTADERAAPARQACEPGSPETRRKGRKAKHPNASEGAPSPRKGRKSDAMPRSVEAHVESAPSPPASQAAAEVPPGDNGQAAAATAENLDGSLEADLLAEEPVLQGPGVLTVTVPTEAVPRIREWLGHLRCIAEVEAEIFPANVGRTDWEGEVPRYLEIACPNGQRVCAGKYRRLARKKVNSQPIWKKVDANRWVYSGTDSTWLVGGVKQRDMDFMCRSGLLHQAKVHGGHLPHRLEPGGWRRVDGSGWVQDPDISITASPVMQPGAPVVVVGGLREGRFGRVVSRREEPETGAVFWTTRFPDGEEELGDELLEVRELQSGEVWLSVAGAAAPARAALAAEALSGTLLGPPMASESESPEVADAATDILLPEELLEKGQAELHRLMEKYQVIFGFLKSSSDDSKASSWLRLLVFSCDPKPGILALLQLSEELLPGRLERMPILCDSFDSSQTSQSSATKRLGCSALRCPVYGGEAALARYLRVLPRCLEVLSAPVGLVSLLVGPLPARQVGQRFLEMVQMWAPEVPHELEAFAASIRVPHAAAEAVEKELESLEVEFGVSGVWCKQTDSQTDSQKLKAELEMDEEVRPGVEVRAVFEDGDWYDATVTDVDALSGKVEIRWSCDSSTSRIPRQDVKPKPSAESKRRQKHEHLLAAAWRLAVFGPLRERKIVVVKIATIVEEQCPGLWTTELLRTTEELRGSVGEDTSIDINVVPLSSQGAGTFLHHLKKQLKEAVRRASTAAGCHIELLRRWALLIVGSSEERSRGKDYLEWLASEERERSQVAPATTSSAIGQDAVRWTDSDGDQLLLRLGERRCLDFFMNGVCKVRDITILAAEGDTLRLRGTGADGATTRCVERPVDEEAASHAVTLFDRSVRARSSSGSQRSDVDVVETTCSQAVWLEPVELRALEKKTKTIVVMPEGCGSNSDWRPDATCKILVCGRDPAGRADAVAKLRDLVQAAKAHQSSEAEAAEEPDPGKDTASSEDPSKKQAPAEPAPDLRQVPAETPPQMPENPEGPTTRSNPLHELRALPWPKDNQTWQSLQERVFWGHPPLPRGWIRIWSRKQDKEYYLRVTDGKTTFNIADTGFRISTP